LNRVVIASWAAPTNAMANPQNESLPNPEASSAGSGDRGGRLPANLWDRVRSWPRWLQTAALLLAGLTLLTGLYLGVALRVPYNAEHAALMLMARSMLQGNWMLHGWTVAHQPLFTTELPFYVVGILLFGFSWKVLYLVTALHWALLATIIIYLSVTGSGARLTPARLFVPLSLTFFLPGVLWANAWISANHLVGFFYCLVCLVAIRDISRGARWQGAAVYGLFLTLAAIGDQFAIYLIAIPVIAVCLIRMIAYGPERRINLLLAATVIAAGLSRLVVFIIPLVGGAQLPGPPSQFVSLPDLENNVYAFVASLLTLFDVNILGSNVESLRAIAGLVHLAAFLLFAAAAYVAVRSIKKLGLPAQIVVAVIAFNLAEFMFSAHTSPGASKYMAPTLFFGIVLVSDWVYDSWLFRHRKTLVLLFLALLLVSLVPSLSYAKPDTPDDELSRILVREHLTHGYAPYWRADNTTLATAGQALVAAVYLVDGKLHPYPVFSDDGWYKGYANFLVIDAFDTSGLHPTREQAIQMFGAPAQEYELYKYGYLLVWDHSITPGIVVP
jgi:hypothetical protein